jgi:large subunit ribosomal protein L24
MASKVHVKKGDNVVILSGKDAGKKGKVLTVIPDESKIIVEGINMVTKHTKPRGRGQTGGIIHQEGTIYASKAMHVCNKCNKPTRLAKKYLEDGKKVRYCKHCGEVFDN